MFEVLNVYVEKLFSYKNQIHENEIKSLLLACKNTPVAAVCL